MDSERQVPGALGRRRPPADKGISAAAAARGDLPASATAARSLFSTAPTRPFHNPLLQRTTRKLINGPQWRRWAASPSSEARTRNRRFPRPSPEPVTGDSD